MEAEKNKIEKEKLAETKNELQGQENSLQGRENALQGQEKSQENPENIQKNPERLKILQKIAEFEKKGWWSKDVEDDPPTIPLTPDKVDYLNSKLSNKIISKYAMGLSVKFVNNLLKTKQMIIKNVVGIENFTKLKGQGAILTCNHFNAYDNFCIHSVLRPYLRKEGKELHIIIREGNYTNFPGFFGFIMRHCYTLPLSANYSTMKKFLSSLKVLLGRGEKILIYPEQGMWWNYRKPRPPVNGAFRFAVENNVPVLPMFITMEDSDLIDGDGFPVQEYTLNILPALYPDPEKSKKENIEWLKNENYRLWKEVYEDFYKIPLTYSTEGGDAGEKTAGDDDLAGEQNATEDAEKTGDAAPSGNVNE